MYILHSVLIINIDCIRAIRMMIETNSVWKAQKLRSMVWKRNLKRHGVDAFKIKTLEDLCSNSKTMYTTPLYWFWRYYCILEIFSMSCHQFYLHVCFPSLVWFVYVVLFLSYSWFVSEYAIHDVKNWIVSY